jgi:hypothetical protein
MEGEYLALGSMAGAHGSDSAGCRQGRRSWRGRSCQRGRSRRERERGRARGPQRRLCGARARGPCIHSAYRRPFANYDPQDILAGGPARLYLFQFPTPFPTFTAPGAAAVATPKSEPSGEGDRRVAFAGDTKPGGAAAAAEPAPKEPSADRPVPLDGVIGELEIRRSGAATMRLGGGKLVLEVSGSVLGAWAGEWACRSPALRCTVRAAPFIGTPALTDCAAGRGGHAARVPAARGRARCRREAARRAGRDRQAVRVLAGRRRAPAGDGPGRGAGRGRTGRRGAAHDGRRRAAMMMMDLVCRRSGRASDWLSARCAVCGCARDHAEAPRSRDSPGQVVHQAAQTLGKTC